MTTMQNAENTIATPHFAIRSRERQVPAEAVALALRHGRQFHEGHDTVHFLGRREIGRLIRSGVAVPGKRWEGIVVVRAGNTLKTTFQNPGFLRTLKRRRWGASHDPRHAQGRRRLRER